VEKMEKRQRKNGFMDLKFFLGLIFSIYGSILLITGIYYVLNPISGLDTNINIYWGLFMLAFGVINYYRSSKPKSWNKAFATSGIEHIEKRLKGIVEETKEELK
jgi:uncharacterized membrane protein HdeD (DUF308 family)